MYGSIYASDTFRSLYNCHQSPSESYRVCGAQGVKYGTEIEAEVKSVPYTVICVDEDGNQIQVFKGTVSVKEDPVSIYPDYQIDGYERIGDNELYMEKNSWNDIGLKFGVANAGNEIEVECETIDGWRRRRTLVVLLLIRMVIEHRHSMSS